MATQVIDIEMLPLKQPFLSSGAFSVKMTVWFLGARSLSFSAVGARLQGRSCQVKSKAKWGRAIVGTPYCVVRSTRRRVSLTRHGRGL
jgi:hypothetical protein